MKSGRNIRRPTLTPIILTMIASSSITKRCKNGMKKPTLRRRRWRSIDKSIRRICWKVETMTVMSNSKSELSISFFHILHTNIVLEILINCLALWKKLLRKSTSLQAGPAPSSLGGQCQNLVVPSKVLCKLIPHVVFISWLQNLTAHMRGRHQGTKILINFWGPLMTRNSFLFLIDS